METPRGPQSVEATARRRLLITGASGYIGRRLVSAARAAGHDVVAGARNPARLRSSAGVSGRAFDLERAEAFAEDFPEVDAVIHLAAVIAEDSHPPGVAEDVNVSGTRKLLEAARRTGVRRFLFVSSQSASEDAPSRYGRSKWAIEQLLTGPGEIIVRPGMVFGGPPRGLYGLLCGLCRTSPILPMVRGSAPVYPVHVDDLCRGILQIAAATEPGGERIRFIVPREPQRFADYVRAIARERIGTRVRLVPVPAALVLLASRITESVPWLPTVSRERVLGLVALKPYPARTSGSALPRLRGLGAALALEGRTRRLIAEGRTLVTYVLGGAAPPGAVRRYVRAVRQDERNEPLELPRFVKAWPRLLRALEPLAPEATLRRRLSLATRIAEMTPAGARRFHEYQGRPLPWVWLVLGLSFTFEAFLLPVRWIAGRFAPPGRSARPVDESRRP